MHEITDDTPFSVSTFHKPENLSLGDFSGRGGDPLQNFRDISGPVPFLGSLRTSIYYDFFSLTLHKKHFVSYFLLSMQD